MEKFQQIPYKRPDMEAIRGEMEGCIGRFRKAEGYHQAMAAFRRMEDRVPFEDRLFPGIYGTPSTRRTPITTPKWTT